MNERSGHRGPNRALLLLIPAALILAKGARHRRARWESAWGPTGAGGGAGRVGHRVGHGFGRHSGFEGGEEAAEGRGFRLPPKIEWMLDTWHTRAHQATEAAEPTTV
jgi:hypothetical protein